jgi:hypothetical protein
VGTLLAIAACVVASSACPVTQPEPTVPVEQFTAVYERSGGLKPMPQKLVVRPGRHVTATTVGASGRPRTARFRISVLKAKQLRNGLQTARLDEIDPGAPGSCADCYFYSLSFRGDTVTISQADVPVGLSRTIKRFEALIEAHLPFH